MKSKASEIFSSALLMEPGNQAELVIDDLKKFKSIKAQLYMIKKELGDEEIKISTKDSNTIILRKVLPSEGQESGIIMTIKEIPKEEMQELTFSVSKRKDGKKQKPGQAEVDALEKERLELHETMRTIVLAFPNERIAQEEINNPESEIFSLQTKLDLLVKRIKSLRDLYEIPAVRISATEEEYLRFEKEFQDEQEKERLAAEALADSLEC